MEYRITDKPITSGNSTSNEILERRQQVLENLVQTCNITQTYADKDGPWLEILTASALLILSTTNMLKGYSTGQLVFGCDMILPIKHTMDRE